MNQNYETLIIGAGLTGIGLACADKENSLIIERTISPGSEYINAFNPGNDWQEEPLTSGGKNLKKELEDRNILCDGKVHISALSPVLYSFIKTEKLNVLFWTEITGIEKVRGNFEVEIYNASGLRKIKVKKIIDTSPERRSAPDKSSIISKSINALLHCEKEISSFELKNGKLLNGRFPSEKYFSLPVEVNDSWPDARKKLFAAWEKRPGKLSGWLIAATASEFAYSSAKGPFEIKNNWLHLPSAAYSNPIQSFEAGVNFFKGEQQCSCQN
ncbi:MAG: hypothetical protein PHV82_07680 [Victivallaceae bacterium]|nr:hypothetical protein [Victivallaceae bacterium]